MNRVSSDDGGDCTCHPSNRSSLDGTPRSPAANTLGELRTNANICSAAQGQRANISEHSRQSAQCWHRCVPITHHLRTCDRDPTSTLPWALLTHHHDVPVFEDVVDVSLVVYADEEAAVSPVDEAELLTGQADRGRVDERHHLLHVLRE